MLQDDRPPSQRFRIVKPDSIASLFAKQQQQQQQQGLSVNSTPSFLSTAREELRQEEEEEEEVEDYDDYDEDDDDVEEEDQDEEWQVSSGSIFLDASNQSSLLTEAVVTNVTNALVLPIVVQEEEKMAPLSNTAILPVIIEEDEEVMATTPQSNTPFLSIVAKKEEDEEEEQDVWEEEEREELLLDYINLHNLLDQTTSRYVTNVIGIAGQSLPTVSTSGATTLSSPSPLAMTPSSLSSSIDMNKGSLIDESGDAPRVIVYNPQERIGGDRMQYGAYRNFHKPGKTKQRNKPKEKKNTSRKDSKATTTDSFYNSIRKLGRKDGPFTQGEPSKTTFADPPGPPPPSSTSSTWAKSNNIKSKKTPPSKGKSGKKVITPSEINSLFQSPEKRQEEIEKEDERDLPQWLVEANRERRKRLEARSSVGGINEKKKSKKLTDDWRFWLAIIGAVGMLNAAINVYQHTNMISGGGGVIM
eukprot:gene11237-12534_t